MRLHEEEAQEPQPRWRSAYLTVNALSPVSVVYVCLYELHSIVAAIFVFHALCLVTMPALLVSLDPRCGRTLEWYKTHVRQQLVPENWRAQLPFALGAMLLITVGGFLGFVFEQYTLHLVPNRAIVQKTEANGLDYPRNAAGAAALLGLAAWFSFVNPFLEEVFWRVYLRCELQDPFCSAVRPQVVSSEVGAAGPEPTETAKWMASCYFASYHVVVVTLFLPWGLALLAGVGLALVGRGLVWVQENERFGLLTSFGVHIGLDVAFCLIVAQLYFRVVPTPGA
eukprot:GHVU01143690.1.p1 GENE.GHVU01143690.1~~GHVU01143690.1.p1  ORF type:complete len:302 (+),score=28.46 GHVU01143690.1:62-907(+)